MSDDDDLTPYADSPAVAALRAPASTAELAGEDAALAMFRANTGPRRRGRALRRIGVGGSGLVLGLALTGGVAAAYTTGLPDPVQNALHSSIETLGLPAPPTADVRRLRQEVGRQQARGQHRAGVPVTALPRRSRAQQPRPGATPTGAGAIPQPTAPGNYATGTGAAGSGAPGAGAPSSSPTSAPTSPTLSSAVSSRVVPVHSGVVLSGRLTRGSDGLPGRRVYAAELVAGTSTWQRVADAQTASDGTVSLDVPALTSNVRLRLVTESGVASRQIPVAVVPALSISVAPSQGQRVATVTADGGTAGDDLVLLRRDGNSWTRVATTTLDSSSSASFTVPGPGPTRVRYRVRLPATNRHAASFAEFAVAAR